MIKIEDPIIRQELCRYLTEFITEERNNRLKEVLSLRTRQVTVVLEDLYQTQNISAVVRTCECYGIQDMHVVESENMFQIHNTIAMGADKWLTINNYPSSTHNMSHCIEHLKEDGYCIAATLPAEKSLFIQDVPVDRKTAFLFGTELTGLSEEAKEQADIFVKIPMYGFTESYNVSNSAAIILSNFVERMRKADVRWQLSEKEQEELYFEWLQKSIRMSDKIIKKYLEEKKSCL